MRDVIPARALGGRGVLVPAPSTPQDEIAEARREFSVAESLDEVATTIIESGA